MRYSYEKALYEYRKLKDYLQSKGYNRVEPSGSLRREKEDVGDIDFVVLGEKEEVLKVVEEYREVDYRINEYEFQLKSGISIHTIPEVKEMYNFTLWQSSGPKPHVKWIKEIYRKQKKELIKLEIDEKDIYKNIGLIYIEPKDRYKYLGE